MFLTILGLLITAAVSLEGIISSNRGRGLKLVLAALAVSGLIVAWTAAYRGQVSKEKAQQQAQENDLLLQKANQQLENQGKLLQLVNFTVGDLGTLNRLSGGEKYYVRIAAGPKPVLEQYLNGIEKKFKGARSSGLVSVRPLRQDCNPEDMKKSCYALVFGSNLNPAAAEVYERFANENGFPPPNQHAVIEGESGSSVQ